MHDHEALAMIHELRLIPRGGDRSLVVTWDDMTGAIRGDGAEHAVAAIERYAPRETIPIEPEGSGYTLSAEPSRSLADMVAILHNSFRVPDWLMAYYPTPDQDDGDCPAGDELPETPLEH